MTITRQADYAVRAVLYLCQHGPTARIVTSEIGREQHIPVTFLAKIIAQLSSAGIVRSTRGAHGGDGRGTGDQPGEWMLLWSVKRRSGPQGWDAARAPRSA